MEGPVSRWMRRTTETPGKRKSGVPGTSYTADGTVGGGIVQVLRRLLVPSVLPGREMVGLCSPGNQGDIALGVYLYDIRENEDMRIQGMYPMDEGHQQFPPMFLNLYYMLTAYSTVDPRYQEAENYRILLGAMQVLHDCPLLDQVQFQPVEEISPETLRVHYQNLTFDQKQQIWQSCKLPMQLSLYYCVAPVRLDSGIYTEVKRVKEIQLHTREL